ncbi:ATP-binding cassette domain-containing protein, partial [Glaesserella parasuis]|uniref:ATP-binding cassette domain-containing protein n=1 Tax=Glaesserella parasuis TaxID=738 RepID=UPI003B7B9CBA
TAEEPLRLVGVESPAAGVAEVHEMKMEGDVMRMRAIDGLDFSVRPGELRCILGPNGAGKSTLFKLLMGVERPSEGQVFYRGRDVTRLGTHERARLGLTCKFQNVPIY